MLIDRSHRGWAIFFGVALTGSTIAYAVYATRTADGPTGGSFMGLVFGIAGTACMGAAALLSVMHMKTSMSLSAMRSMRCCASFRITSCKSAAM